MPCLISQPYRTMGKSRMPLFAIRPMGRENRPTRSRISLLLGRQSNQKRPAQNQHIDRQQPPALLPRINPTILATNSRLHLRIDDLMPARLSSMDLSDDNSSTPRAAANGYAPADNATNRRKSVRVVKKPKLFVQEPAVPTRAKRKRAEAPVEDDASGKEDSLDDDDDEDEDEGEADLEELKEKRRKNPAKRKAKAPAKPAAKKVKKTRAAPSPAVKKTPVPKSANGPTSEATRKVRRGRAKQAGSGESGEGLYGELFKQLTSKSPLNQMHS
ncbi:MAG: hypothetical protein M1839_005909 [Geoglossum umbratile]|nr:MAG: hypothetical protein M1839_005909 [Geoglossum umbratile]